jgi:hypothetical protein
MAHLHQARRSHLVVDCGDWFEGTGYYQLGAGVTERQILTRLYDVVAPGNHGFKFYLRDEALHRITVCANVVDASGAPVFPTVNRMVISGLRVAVTGIMGPEAFDAVRVDQRRHLRLLDPAQALGDLAARMPDVDSWVLLSHAGFEHDLALARACQHLDLVFAGHCHSAHHGPANAGNALVVKGLERARGYAEARLDGDGIWQANHLPFPPTDAVPPALADISDRITQLAGLLAQPMGPIGSPWVLSTPDRHTLLTAVAHRLHCTHRLPVLLSDSTLRPAQLGEQLHLGDLLALEPFANRLVIADAPDDWSAWLTHICVPELAGPLVSWPDPITPAPRRILTTDYLAGTFLPGSQRPTGLMVADAVRDTLTERPHSCARPAQPAAAPARTR